MTGYPRKLERFITKWKPQLLFCSFITATDEKARKRLKIFGRWEIFAAVIAGIDDRLLVVHERHSESHIGGWSIPGGAVEKDEDVEDGAVREVKEEAGTDVKLVRPTALLRATIMAPTEDSLEYALAIFHGNITGGIQIP